MSCRLLLFRVGPNLVQLLRHRLHFQLDRLNVVYAVFQRKIHVYIHSSNALHLIHYNALLCWIVLLVPLLLLLCGWQVSANL